MPTRCSRKLNVRRTVLSVAGINERGFYNSNLLLVETERAMMHAADEVIVVADSTKFGHQSLAHLVPADVDVNTLVVDERHSTRVAQKIEPPRAWRSCIAADRRTAAQHRTAESSQQVNP